MGCLQAKEKEPEVTEIREPPPKTVDPRLPFETYRQLFNLKNSWKSVTRALEATAIENLILFFRRHPEHKAMHKNLVRLETEEAMRSSTDFENAAVDVFNTIDQVMMATENVDMAIKILHMAGKAHGNIEGFQPSYFQDMEESFVDSIKGVLEDRFTLATEENFRLLYQFVCKHMTDPLEVETTDAQTK